MFIADCLYATIRPVSNRLFLLVLVVVLQVGAYFVAARWLEGDKLKKLPTWKALLALLLGYFSAC